MTTFTKGQVFQSKAFGMGVRKGRSYEVVDVRRAGGDYDLIEVREQSGARATVPAYEMLFLFKLI